MSGFIPQLHIDQLDDWASHLRSLHLSFLFCKVGMILLHISEDSLED